MKKLLYLFLFLFFVGCKQDPSLEKDFKYSYKINQVDFLPVVKGELNNKEIYLLLDTGASISVLDTKSLHKYGVTQSGDISGNVTGYGGTTTNFTDLENYNVRIGDIKFNNEFIGRDLTDIKSIVYKATGYEISGILGNNNMKTQRLIIDLDKNYIYKR